MDESSVPTRPEARLIDIAPTILELVGAVRPPHMTGTPLFVSSQGADHP
jgi:bisphosphoglycerate-independent phosphoglycerate mutase (AlkP superfamily)